MNVARRMLSILLVVIGTLVVGLGASLHWVQSHVLDTTEVTLTTRKVLTEPGVQKLLEREIADRVMSYVNDSRYRPIVDGIVKKSVESPKTVDLVVEGVSESHRSFVSGSQPVIVLNLRALAAEVRTQIVAAAPPLDTQLPDSNEAFRFSIANRSELPGAWRWVDRFTGSGIALVVLGTALAGLGFVLGPSRWALAILCGALVLTTGLVTLAISHRAIDEVRTKLTDPTAFAATNAILSEVLRSLDKQAKTLAVTGGFAVLIGVGVRLIRPEYIRSRDPWR